MTLFDGLTTIDNQDGTYGEGRKKNFRLSEKKKTFATQNTRKNSIGTYFRWSLNSTYSSVQDQQRVYVKRKNLFFACCPLHWQSHQWRHDVKRQRCQNKGSRRAHFSRQRHIEIMFLLKVRCYDLLCTEFFYAFSGRKLLNDLLQKNFLCFMTGLRQGERKKNSPLVKCIMRLIMSSLHFSIFVVIYSWNQEIRCEPNGNWHL